MHEDQTTASETDRPLQSVYMNWAKTQPPVRFNLAASGAADVPFAALPQLGAELEITTRMPYGYPPLLQAIAARYGAAADNVVTAAGCSMANHLAMAALIRPGDEVLMEWPVYEPMLAVARYLGARVKFFSRAPERQFAVDADALEALFSAGTRLVVLSNLHNPSSALIPEQTLRRIGRAAARVGAYVLVDEAYLDMAGVPLRRSAFHLGTRFVVTSSLTKAYGLSGLRCGWILAEAGLAARIWRLNDLFGVTHPYAAERMSLAAFPHLDRLGEQARQRVALNRQALHAFYDSRRDLLTYRAEYGNTDFPGLLQGSVEQLCTLLRERFDTAVVPGRYFGLDRHFRLGLTGDPAMLAEALRRLGAALDELNG